MSGDIVHYVPENALVTACNITVTGDMHVTGIPGNVTCLDCLGSLYASLSCRHNPFAF